MYVCLYVCSLLGHMSCDLAQKRSARSLVIAGRWGQPVMAVSVCMCRRVVRGGRRRLLHGGVVVCSVEGSWYNVCRPHADPAPASTHTHTHGQRYKLKSAGCGNERQVHREAVRVTGRENERGQKEHVKVKAGGKKKTG